jgi:hypothetical protein
MRELIKAIAFIRDVKMAEPSANKAFLQAKYIEAFNPERLGKVFIGDGYALRFSEVLNGRFSGTALSLSALRPQDHRPFVVVVAQPSRVDFLLANSTFLKKVSHSSQVFRIDKIRGSVNGSGILTEYEGIKNEPEFFPELFAFHESFTWEENVERLVEATNAIVPRQSRFVPTAAERGLPALHSRPSPTSLIATRRGFSNRLVHISSILSRACLA